MRTLWTKRDLERKKLSLILDHINGINNDNRLENLRIVCPNCNATLDTHCRKNNKPKSQNKTNYCNCGKPAKNKYCSRQCSDVARTGRSRLKFRHPNRPDDLIIIQDVKTSSYRQLAKKYNVSPTTIAKWKIEALHNTNNNGHL